MIDPEVIRKLLRRRSNLDELTPRESDVLALGAPGKTNAAVAKELVLTDAAVAKRINRIFTSFGLGDHKRVQAVRTCLRQ